MKNTKKIFPQKGLWVDDMLREFVFVPSLIYDGPRNTTWGYFIPFSVMMMMRRRRRRNDFHDHGHHDHHCHGHYHHDQHVTVTCCKAQCPEAICVLKARAICQHLVRIIRMINMIYMIKVMNMIKIIKVMNMIRWLRW